MKKICCLLVFLPALSWAKEVLYVGDSHSYLARLVARQESEKRLGHILIEGLQAKGDHVTYIAACGSAPIGWARGGSTSCGYSSLINDKFFTATKFSFSKLTQLVHGKPDEIIVNLGDNMFEWERQDRFLFGKVVSANVQHQMRSFFSMLTWARPSNCRWVGPTYHLKGSNYFKPNRAVDQMYEALALAVKDKCTLVDSRPMVNVRVPNDGLHHVGEDSRAWGRGILKSIQQLRRR